MNKITIEKSDECYFTNIGHRAEDLRQIRALSYKFYDEKDKELSYAEVLKRTDKESLYAAVGRAAFHCTASLRLHKKKYGGVKSNLLSFLK